ncbi:RluA family pseudouridine synthase [Halobacillus seohaensis]
MITPTNALVKNWRVTEEITLKDFLRRRASFSRQLLKRVKKSGLVKVDGVQVPMWSVLQSGREVTVIFPEEEKGTAMNSDPLPLSIIYEDEDIMVLNKKSGMAVMPGRDHSTGTLAQAILDYYEQSNLPFTVHLVTRLDRDTSGLVLVAKHSYSHSLLTGDLDQVERVYTALIEGHLPCTEGIVDEPIRRSPHSIIEHEVNQAGKRAVTEYSVVKKGNVYSKIECKLRTGRTHQIRVHMASLGFPLVGDTLYGGRNETQLVEQALHCHQLTLQHPWTEKWMLFSSNPPEVWNDYI